MTYNMRRAQSPEHAIVAASLDGDDDLGAFPPKLDHVGIRAGGV